eukprot:m.167360 g.167360  ORF g.167360 m.167360 type:complete len:63 (+) comp17193_c0_seq5:3590-3778(+)
MGYVSAFFGRQGSIQPMVHAMIALSAFGYALAYNHIQAEYKAEPPAWSRYAKKGEQQQTHAH